jgi:hypothetical protein
VHSHNGRRSAPDEGIGKNPDMPPSENGNDRDVLTSLPRTRPARRSAKRDRPARGATPAEAREAAAPADTPARAKARAAAKPKPAATPRAQRPKRAATTTAGARKAKTTSARSKPGAATRARPEAARRPAASEPAVPPAGYATPAPEHGGPDPFALFSTTMQAAGEIAQIGATFWTQAIRSAMNRFPKP